MTYHFMNVAGWLGAMLRRGEIEPTTATWRSGDNWIFGEIKKDDFTEEEDWTYQGTAEQVLAACDPEEDGGSYNPR